MNLQTRFILWIAAGALAVLIASEALRQHHQHAILKGISEANLQRLEASSRNAVRNLQLSVDASLRDAMEQGEMDRITKVLARQGRIEGMLECSLVGADGRVSYSSLPSAMRQPMEASLRAQLFGSTNRLEQLTSEAFEIYQPLVAEKACIACHNQWKEGQIGGVELIRLSNAELRHAQSEWAASETRMRRDQWVGGIATCVGLLLAVVILVSGLLRWLLTRPLLRITKGLDAVSQGDVSNDVDAALQARKDEIGHLAQSIQAMTESLRRLLRNVADGVQTLASSASGLSTISNRTTANVRGVSDRATTVAEAATASSAHAASVASSMEEAAANLCSVAGATEQMSSTVTEIASHSEKARVIGDQAMHQAQSVSSLMQELGSAAQAIGKVTETITDISAQTNLLALNATIEAARAGAAGKGFAVVASEIKALAHQTATATEDIKAKITGVQTTSSNVVADIGRITTVIKDVGQIVSTIAAAIEEQATVTKDLAGNVAHASTGVSDANQRVAQAADAARSMAVDISGINTAVADLRQGGEQVQARSAELSGLAEQLKAQVDRFKLTGPASAAVLVDSIAGSQPEARLHRAASAA